MCLHTPLFCDLARALETLELLGAPGRHDFLVMAALETGGFFHMPERANNWDSQQVEIRAHGVFASGTDEAEAIRNWMLLAATQRNDPTKRPPMFRRSQKTESLCRMFRETNGTISYDRIEAETGEKLADLRQTLTNVRKYLERDEGIVFDCVYGVGYKRLTDAEKVESTAKFSRRIRRSAVQGVQRVNTVSNFTGLSNEDQMTATLRRTVFETVQREVGE
jgi:hypothetical protein